MVLALRGQTTTASHEQQTTLQEQQDQLERKFLQSQRRSLERSLADAQALTEGLNRRYRSVQQLLKEGLIAPDRPRRYSNPNEYGGPRNQAQILDYKAKLDQIDGRPSDSTRTSAA